jgi:hypothetical protein
MSPYRALRADDAALQQLVTQAAAPHYAALQQQYKLRQQVLLLPRKPTTQARSSNGMSLCSALSADDAALQQLATQAPAADHAALQQRHKHRQQINRIPPVYW